MPISFSKTLVFTLASLLILCCGAYGFYLPGVAPHEYNIDDSVKAKVEKLASSKTQIPYEFYTLPFCTPKEGVRQEGENLGEILFGDRTEPAPYEFNLATKVHCKPLCVSKFEGANLKKLSSIIEDDYYVQMTIDDLPVASSQSPSNCGTLFPESGLAEDTYFSPNGFPVGCTKKEAKSQKFLNNHINFIVKYHFNEKTGRYRVVGASAYPSSVKHEVDENNKITTCDATQSLSSLALFDLPSNLDQPTLVPFSYSVTWVNSEIRWASRWDAYLHSHGESSQVHWFSIINSLMIVLFLSGMVGMIMMRALRRDFTYYEQMESTDDITEETGWKLVHGDVFRAPDHSNLFSTFVGTGVQVNAMFIITLVFALLGFLSPAIRGALMTAMLFLFVFMGILSGYVSSRMYKMFKGEDWKQNTLLTAFLIPGVVFCVFITLNFILSSLGSSGAIPFAYFMALIALWFGISVPLVFLGFYFGFKQPTITFPIRTNQIPRQIPDQPWYMQTLVSSMIGGVLPFGAVFIEMYFILTSIWQNNFYYVFGFLFVVFLILVITCAEITIVMIYFQLCSEDYHWWWRSYFTSGSSAVYMFLYSMFYLVTRLHMHRLASIVLFTGYTAILCLIFFVLTGSIGFFSCYLFIHKIYSSIKVD